MHVPDSFTNLLGTSPHTVAAGDLVDGDNKLEVTAIVSGGRIGPFEVNCQRTSGGTTTTIQHSGTGQFVCIYLKYYHPNVFSNQHGVHLVLQLKLLGIMWCSHGSQQALLD